MADFQSYLSAIILIFITLLGASGLATPAVSATTSDASFLSSQSTPAVFLQAQSHAQPTPTLTPTPPLTSFPSPLPATPTPTAQDWPPWQVLLNLGLPIPATLGLQSQLTPSWSVLAAAGYLPVPLGPKGTFSAGQIELAGHYHPFANAFFLSAQLGYQLIQWQAKLSLGSLAQGAGPINSQLRLESLYLGVGLGAMWQLSEHFFLGFDLGLNFPCAASGSISMQPATPAGDSLVQASRDALTYFAHYPLPSLHLVRLGWSF